MVRDLVDAGARLLAQGSHNVRADQLFDDMVNVTGMEDDDAEPNSRVEDHRLHHQGIAQEVTAISYIGGIGFDIANRTKQK